MSVLHVPIPEEVEDRADYWLVRFQAGAVLERLEYARNSARLSAESYARHGLWDDALLDIRAAAVLSDRHRAAREALNT